ALSNEDIQREAIEPAEDQLSKIKAEAIAGKVAPIDAVSVEAELEERKDDAMSALLATTQAENALKNLILGDPSSEIWNYTFIPTDPIEISSNSVNLQDAIDISLKNRPEIKQLKVQSEINKVNIDFFKNQQKPQLDFKFAFTA